MQHRQIDRPLHVEAELPTGQQVFEHSLATGLDPQSAKDQIGSDARTPQLPELTPIAAPQNGSRSETRCYSRAFPGAHRKSVEVGLDGVSSKLLRVGY